jgi:Lysozyme like domain
MRGLGAPVSVLSPAQIQQLAANAGFSGDDLNTAVAIALAESFPSGNPNSYNPETSAGAPAGKGSYGLWQIYLAAHPEFAGQNLFDPQTNANAAYSVYLKAGGFSPWTTYTSGAYQQYLNATPVTLDAATGLPISDSTDVAALPVVGSSFLDGIDPTTLGLTVLALGGLLLYDFLSD